MTYIKDLVWASCVSEITIRYCSARLAGLLITITYMALLYGTYVPDWEYRICCGWQEDATDQYELGIADAPTCVCWHSAGINLRYLLSVRLSY